MFPLAAAEQCCQTHGQPVLIDAQGRGNHRANSFLLIVAENPSWPMLSTTNDSAVLIDARSGELIDARQRGQRPTSVIAQFDAITARFCSVRKHRIGCGPAALRRSSVPASMRLMAWLTPLAIKNTGQTLRRFGSALTMKVTKMAKTTQE